MNTNKFSEIQVPGGLHDGEKILVYVRRHWFVMVQNGILFLFFMVLPFGLYFLIPQNFFDLIQGTVWQGIITMFFAVFYLCMWLFFFASLVDYYLDVWVVTNERIIDVQQVSLFKHVVAEQRIIRVQDVTSVVKGIIPTFLNYGNVSIQTAGEVERFIFQQVPNPEKIRNTVIGAYEDVIKNSGEAFAFSDERKNFDSRKLDR